MKTILNLELPGKRQNLRRSSSRLYVNEKMKTRSKPMLLELFGIILALVTILLASTTIIVMYNQCVLSSLTNSSTLAEKRNVKPSLLDEKELIERTRWSGKSLVHPVAFVVISDTKQSFCRNFTQCSRHVREINEDHIIINNKSDIDYNFLIGGDARVYVGTGWDAVNFCSANNSVRIGFIGTYSEYDLKPNMIIVAMKLLDDGLKKGKISKNYKLIANNQSSLGRQIKAWPHFNRKWTTNCREINANSEFHCHCYSTIDLLK